MIISPNNNIERVSNSVFLAGPCFDKETDWRNEAIKYFNELGFNGDIIDPRNYEYDGQFEKQTIWENKMFHIASCVMFWIPRTPQNPSIITNFELGKWIDCESVFVGFPDDSYKNEYIDLMLRERNIPRYKTLKEMVVAVVKKLNRKKKIFFTSDTHFSMQRTLELSYRPFRSVMEMDLQLISNWNKRVTMNDTVIHLGDFGNPQIFKMLNCEQMFFLPGNYERKIDEFSVSSFFGDERVVQMEEKQIQVNKKQYYICHEPINNKFNPENKFYLYGHIHRLQMVKRNGVNVGIDANRFKPMSFSELQFLENGIKEHFDENVFTDNCK